MNIQFVIYENQIATDTQPCPQFGEYWKYWKSLHNMFANI